MASKVTFDTANKRIVCKAGVTELDVRVDLYSDAKEDWKADADLNKHLFPFEVVGGNPIDEGEGVYVTSYYFLKSDWRVRPQEADHTLKVKGGILLTLTGDDPFVPTQSAYNVQVKYSQPIKSETVSISGGSGLTQDEHDQLMAAALEATVDTVKTDTEAIIADVAGVKADTEDILSATSTLQSTMATLGANVLSLREGNVQRTLYLATVQNATRKAAVGAIDREVIKVKADGAADWLAPVSTKTRYFWYRTLGATEAFAIGANA